jgi:phosphoribosyl-ATP pyrophosphohydrolase
MPDQPAPDQPEKDILDAVFDVIEQRKQAGADTSYVARLFAGGAEKINGKIQEEAREVCQAGLEQDHAHLTHELCDLMFHAFVLASHKGVTMNDIRAEFQRRFGTSGLVEKAGRNKK